MGNSQKRIYLFFRVYLGSQLAARRSQLPKCNSRQDGLATSAGVQRHAGCTSRTHFQTQILTETPALRVGATTNAATAKLLQQVSVFSSALPFVPGQGLPAGLPFCLICAVATLPAETLSQVLSLGQVSSVVADVAAASAAAPYVFVFITYVSFLAFCASCQRQKLLAKRISCTDTIADFQPTSSPIYSRKSLALTKGSFLVLKLHFKCYGYACVSLTFDYDFFLPHPIECPI